MPSINTTILNNVVTRKVDLLRFSESVRERLIILLQDLSLDLQKKLNAADLAGIVSTTQRARRAEQIIKQANDIIATAYRTNNQTLDQQLLDLAELDITAAAKVVNAAVGIDLISVTWTPAELKAVATDNLILGSPLADWWAKQSSDMALRFAQQVRMGILGGETNDQIVRRIIGSSTGRRTVIRVDGESKILYQRAGGIMDASYRDATTLVRTAVQTVSNDIYQQTYEDNADILNGVIAIVTLDNRTSIICRGLAGAMWDFSGKPLPQSPVKINRPSGPPFHTNALASGTMITTREGDIPVNDVRVGDLVLTHEKRWRPVYCVMSKRPEKETIRELHLSSGRILRVTDDHPVLTNSGWQKGGDLKVGNVLFQHTQEFERSDEVLLLHPDYFPSPFDEETIAYDVVSSAGMMAFPINFQTDHQVGESKVDRKIIDDMLRRKHQSTLTKQSSAALLSNRRMLSEPGGAADHGFLLDSQFSHGIVSDHSSAGFGRLLSKSTIENARSFGNNFRQSPRDSHLLTFGANDNSITLTCDRQSAVTDFERSFDGSKRLTLPPMTVLDKQHRLAGVGKVDDWVAGHWVSGTIILIVERSATDRIWNLAVEEDETYVAEGVIVHNCRTVIGPLLKSFSQLAGMDLPGINQLSMTTRASMDGQVPAGDLTYEAWLNTKSAAFQQDVLGPGRYQLWKDDDISLAQMIDPSGRALTLDQLRDKVNNN